MSRPAIEAFSLRAVGEAVRVYADNMYIDAYGDQHKNERDYHLRDHLLQLAQHLEETAHDTARVAKISRILER